MANNDTESKWSILKRTVKKIQFLLGGVDITGWRLVSLLRGPTASTIPRLSFNDRVGLQGFIDDEFKDQPSPDGNDTSSERVFQRSASYLSASSSDDDIDRRAEIFISNFYRQLRLERQISLELRYCRPPGFDTTTSSSSSPTP